MPEHRTPSHRGRPGAAIAPPGRPAPRGPGRSRWAGLGRWVLPALAGLLGCAAPGGPTAPPDPSPAAPSPAAATFPDQGWSAAERDWAYSFSQGSRLLPYEWFLALEGPDGAPFRADGPARLGYIPRAASTGNPDALPVGFAVDDARDGRRWIGLNCAACHTGQVRLRGRVVQVDGAPGNGDLHGLLAELAGAMRATLDDAARLARFADAVSALRGGGDPDAVAAELRDGTARFEGFVRDSTPRVAAWGPARTDAFGMIFNHVAAIDLGVPGNSEPPDAPVSYPHLWTTGRQERVQWTGSVPNLRRVERLARNVGQVLGVFGEMPSLGEEAEDGRRFRSSARAANLLRVDRLVGRLRPPAWPGDLDPARVERGRAVYAAAGCGACHADARGRDGPIPVALTGLSDLGTDPVAAEHAAGRRSATGALAGLPLGSARVWPFRARLPDEMRTADLLGLVVRRAILDPDPWNRPADALGALRARIRAGLPREDEEGTALRRELATRTAPVYLAAGTPGAEEALRYKAGPLNGIWATAPFLHNGSVPTLADLLLPPEERPKAFRVGSRALDEAHVGFEHGPGSGGFLFDTARPGNGNGGHAYGTALGEGQRRDLLEYLKQL